MTHCLNARKATVALCCAVAFFFGCQKAPVLTLTGPSTIEVKASGGSETIEFRANRPWSVSSAASWVRVSPSEGAAADESVSVTIRCDANQEYDERSTTVTIRMDELSQTITVKQGPRLGMVVPNASAWFNLSGDGQSIDVEVQSNVEYAINIESGCDWIVLDRTRALETHRYHFLISRNPTRHKRSATIGFNSNEENLHSTVIVNQEAQPILASSDTLNMSGRGWRAPIRVAGPIAEDFMVVCTDLWMAWDGQESSPDGAVFYVKADPLPEGAAARDSRVLVYYHYDNFAVEPDTVYVHQYAPRPVATFTWSGRDVRAPEVGGENPSAFVFWGDETQDRWAAGLTHHYAASGQHTVTVEKQSGSSIMIDSLEDGMTINFRELRK